MDELVAADGLTHSSKDRLRSANPWSPISIPSVFRFIPFMGHAALPETVVQFQNQNKTPNKSLASYSACPTGQQPGPGAGEGKQDGDGGAHVFGAQETRNPCKAEAPKSGKQCVMVWV